MDILHSAFIFRFVIGFAIACPFLIIPAIVSLFKKRPEPENITEAHGGAGPGPGPRLVASGDGAQRTEAKRQPNVFPSGNAAASSPRRAA